MNNEIGPWIKYLQNISMDYRRKRKEEKKISGCCSRAVKYNLGNKNRDTNFEIFSMFSLRKERRHSYEEPG
jgi:hypothetical protein